MENQRRSLLLCLDASTKWRLLGTRPQRCGVANGVASSLLLCRLSTAFGEGHRSVSKNESIAVAAFVDRIREFVNR